MMQAWADYLDSLKAGMKMQALGTAPAPRERKAL
jgi:hypothetical protein